MKYSKEIAEKIIELYSTGNNSVQAICDTTGITRETFYTWKKTNKSFAKKLKPAHELRLENIADMALSGLALLVQKHEYEEVTTEYENDKNGKPKIKGRKVVKKFIMPNPGMITLALTNRMPDDWKQKQAIEHTGKDGEDLNVITIFQLPDNGRDTI